MKRASLANKVCGVQSHNRHFWPAEEVAAVMSACTQTMHKNKVHFGTQKYDAPPQTPEFSVSPILNTRSETFEAFLALDATLKFRNHELSQHQGFSEYFMNSI